MKKVNAFVLLNKRGILSLLAIKLMLILTVLFVNSCKKEEAGALNGPERQRAQNAFKHQVLDNMAGLNNALTVLDRKKNEMHVATEGNEVVLKDADLTAGEMKELKRDFMPFIDNSVEYLGHYGITREDLKRELGSDETPVITTIALLVYDMETNNTSEQVSAINSVLGTSAYAIDGNKLANCVLKRIGGKATFAAVMEIIKRKGLKSVNKAVIIEILKIVGKKSIPFIGWASLAYDAGRILWCYTH